MAFPRKLLRVRRRCAMVSLSAVTRTPSSHAMKYTAAIGAVCIVGWGTQALIAEKILHRERVYLNRPRITKNEVTPAQAAARKRALADAQERRRVAADLAQVPSGGRIFRHPDGRLFSNARTRFRISAPAADDLKEIEYRVDDGPFLPYREPFPLTGQGLRRVQYRGTDRAGNVEPVRAFSVIMDTESPTVFVEPDETFGTSGVLAVEPGGTVQVRVVDSLSGVRSYYVDAGGGFLAGEPEPYSFSTEGRQLLRVIAEDNVGNRSPELHFPLLVDGSAPSVWISPSRPLRRIGGQDYCDGQTEVTIDGRDSGSGIAGFTFRFDGEKTWRRYSRPIPVIVRTDFRIEARAVDAAGNASAVVALACRVDGVSPKTQLRVGGKEETSGDQGP